MAYADFATSASPSVREALGLGSLHVGSTRALAIREDPRTITNGTGGLACGGQFDEGCGTGVVTHADASPSIDGRPTGRGIAPGFPRP